VIKGNVTQGFIIGCCFSSLTLVGCSDLSSAQEGSTKKKIPAPQYIPVEEAPRPVKKWKYAERKISLSTLTDGRKRAKHCENIKQAEEERETYPLAKKHFDNLDYIKSVKGYYYYIKYRGEKYTVYRNIRLAYEPKLFPLHPYRADGRSSRKIDFTIIPGWKHRVFTAFEDMMFFNPVSGRVYPGWAYNEKRPYPSRQISDGNAEILSLILSSGNGFRPIDHDYYWSFRRRLSMDIPKEKWLVRFRNAQPGDVSSRVNTNDLDVVVQGNSLYLYSNKDAIFGYVYNTKTGNIVSIQC